MLILIELFFRRFYLFSLIKSSPYGMNIDYFRLFSWRHVLDIFGVRLSRNLKLYPWLTGWYSPNLMPSCIFYYICPTKGSAFLYNFWRKRLLSRHSNSIVDNCCIKVVEYLSFTLLICSLSIYSSSSSPCLVGLKVAIWRQIKAALLAAESSGKVAEVFSLWWSLRTNTWLLRSLSYTRIYGMILRCPSWVMSIFSMSALTIFCFFCCS